MLLRIADALGVSMNQILMGILKNADATSMKSDADRPLEDCGNGEGVEE